MTQNLLSDRQGVTWTGDLLDLSLASLTLSFGSCLAAKILYALLGSWYCIATSQIAIHWGYHSHLNRRHGRPNTHIRKYFHYLTDHTPISRHASKISFISSDLSSLFIIHNLDIFFSTFFDLVFVQRNMKVITPRVLECLCVQRNVNVIASPNPAPHPNRPLCCALPVPWCHVFWSDPVAHFWA